MEFAPLRHALNRRNIGAIGLDGQDGARLDGLTIDQDGARAALAGVAADVGARQAERFAQVVHQEQACLDLILPRCPVDGNGN
jgi:hypothetical protein